MSCKYRRYGAIAGTVLALALLMPATALAQAARDFFDSGDYSGGSGNIGWSGDWDEVNDDDNPASGFVQVNGGQLELTGASPQAYITREVDLSGQSSAILLFDINSNVGAGLAEESWSTGDYSGGSGWNEPSWTEAGDDGSPSGGNTQADTGALVFSTGSGGDTVSRDVDLTGETSVDIVFDLSCGAGMEDSGGARDELEVLVDGSPVADDTIEGGCSPHTESITVTSFSGITEIGFRAVGLAGGGESYSVDNITIVGTGNDPDAFSVQVSDDGGGTWTEVRNFSGNISLDHDVVDITDFISANTTVRFGVDSGVTDSGEVYVIDEVDILASTLDFETDELNSSGESLASGDGIDGPDLPDSNSSVRDLGNDAVDDQPWDDDGLTVTVETFGGSHGPGMILESDNPFDTDESSAEDSHADPDLGSPNEDCPGGGQGIGAAGHPDAEGQNCVNLNNIFIVQEPGTNKTPDDVAATSDVVFEFDAPVSFFAMMILDDVTLGTNLVLNFEDGGSETVAISELGDLPANGENGKFYITYNDFDRSTDVVSMVFEFNNSSGGIAGLYTSPPGIDFGDAPDSYGTDLDDGGEGVGAGHRIDPAKPLFIGSDVDSESDGQPSSGADGDDSGSASSSTDPFDDEDGVSMPNGSTDDGIYTVTVDVTNETGEDATLAGWVDFDQDGVFDSDEGVTVTVPSQSGSQSIDLELTVPEGDRNNTGDFVGRFRLTTDALTTADATGLASDGEVEDHVANISSLPVSLNSFESSLFGSRLDVEWSTSSETFNVGFHVWGKLEGEWRRLTDEPVLSRSTDAVTPESYRTRIRVTDFDPRALEGLALSSIETTGSQELYGTFEVGESYGEEALPEPIPWQAIRNEHNARMSERGYVRHGRKWYQGRGRAASSEDTPVVELLVTEAGMQRVSYSDLRAAGLDLRGVRPEAIAVTLKGEGVPRHIETRGRRGFGPGDHIDFWGRQPDFPDALYIPEYIYRIEVNPAEALSAGRVSREVETGQSQALFPLRVNEDNAYSFVNATADPWHARMLMHPWGPKSYSAGLEVDGALVADAPGRVEAVLTAFSDFPEVNPDHRIQLIVNGQVVLQEDVSGHRAVTLSAPVPAGVLTEGDNTVEVSLPGGTAAPYDIVTVDRLALWYPRALTTASNALHVEGSITQGGLAARGFTSEAVEAYATDAGGNLARLNVTRRMDPQWQAAFAEAMQQYWMLRFRLIFARWDRQEHARLMELIREVYSELQELQRNPSWLVTAPAVADTPGVEGVEYWLSAPSRLNQPEVLGRVQVDEQSLLNQPADFLLIVHPSFMPDDGESSHPLNRYMERRESQGWRVRAVGLDTIQNVYGGGMALPQAVTGFLKAADEAFDYSHVLLVGDDSYDYLDKLGLGSVSFVPTMYADTNQIHHSPSDGLMTDLDGDGISDKAVGRWPVRTLTDLSVMVQKTLDWEDPVTGPRDDRTSVWVTDSADPSVPSFESQAERMIDTLRTPQAGGHGEPWPETNLSRVYFDQVTALPGQSVAATARGELMAALAEGQTITGFAGHGSPTDWTFQGLMSARHVKDMDNAGRPTLITTLTCYTSYFVSPSTDTLAHRLMAGYRVDGDGEPLEGAANGAVAVHGAATLSGYGDNEKLARTALEHQISDGDTLGEAILKARRAAAAAGRTDTASNWALLGDPTLTVEP